jgi:hypothetical protein
VDGAVGRCPSIWTWAPQAASALGRVIRRHEACFTSGLTFDHGGIGSRDDGAKCWGCAASPVAVAVHAVVIGLRTSESSGVICDT